MSATSGKGGMGRAAQAGQGRPAVGGDEESGQVRVGPTGVGGARMGADAAAAGGVPAAGASADAGASGEDGHGARAKAPVAGGTSASGPAWMPPDRPLRADARRNRDAVLTAAAAAFASQGVEAPLEDIARAAGVGVGTLYRHFPNREALVFGVYAREVEQLAASAPELAAELEPAEALREWMRRFVRYAATKRGLKGMLRTMMEDDSALFDRTKAQIAEAASLLLERAAAAGQVRDDIAAEDLTRSMSGICMASNRDGGPECAGRLVDLVFDGLRYGAPAAH